MRVNIACKAVLKIIFYIGVSWGSSLDPCFSQCGLLSVLFIVRVYSFCNLTNIQVLE